MITLTKDVIDQLSRLLVIPEYDNNSGIQTLILRQQSKDKSHYITIDTTTRSRDNWMTTEEMVDWSFEVMSTKLQTVSKP